MLYMVVEHFMNQDPLPVYRRFRDHGRLAPEGLQYVSSWVDERMERWHVHAFSRTSMPLWVFEVGTCVFR